MEQSNPTKQAVPSSCPHCGNSLTPWQQVLLATDRALVCKKCWYRIIIDVYGYSKSNPIKIDKSKKKEE